MPAPTRLPWPDQAPVAPVEPLRPVLEAFSSLALRHPEDVALRPALVDEDGTADESADPPPALVQIAEEFGGIDIHGRTLLDLLVDERTDLGPYTLLGDPTGFYPLHEGEDVAVVLTVEEDGALGAVFGIGEDLSMTLVARTLGHFLERSLHAFTEVLDDLDGEITRTRGADAVADQDVRAEAASELIDAGLLGTILGHAPAEDVDDIEDIPVLSVEESGFEEDDLPEGTIAVADLRDAPLGAVVRIMDADLPGDPVEYHLAFSHGGRVISIIDDEEAAE